MRRIVSLLVISGLLMALPLIAAETWKGAISDKMCGVKHHGDDPVKCTLSCVKAGSPYVFVVKDKVIDIENQKDSKIAAALQKYAGLNVEISGTMSTDGKNVKVDSIKSAK